LEGLKRESEKGTKSRLVSSGSLRQTARESMLEEGEVLIVFVVETFFANKFPEPFNQIEIGGVRREKEDLNVQTSGNP
jgi:hypothetical protein